ncbi:DUF2142 domain-containing protein [Allofournierella massiliensis]|uniref:Putative membrane protein n=1 Tax=Allofournierella massiliensis TaxID=1650663 RepID=A0A4R1QLX5_9FIRM|nr:DUF2142 domain-containing protein [Fournierella massiliensis]TCL54709.1 putative membrane protein [Fournierella massiliensis]
MEKLLTQLKTHRRLLGGAALLAVAFFIFACIWLTQVRGNGEKSRSWMINDQFSEFALIDDTVTQDFVCDRDLLYMGFAFKVQKAGDEGPAGVLELTLTDLDTGEVLATSEGDMSNILDTTEAYYTTLGLSQPVELTSFGERHYRVTLTAHYTGEGRLLIGYTPTANEAGLGLTVNGQPTEGMLAILGVYAQIGGFLTKFYWVIALLALVLIGAGWWLFTGQKCPLHRMVFCFVLALGILFSMVLPPYSAPDEQFHINQSFTLASTIYDPHLPIAQSQIHSTIRRPSDQDVIVQDGETTVFTWQHIAKNLLTTSPDPFTATHDFDEYQVDSSYTMYWISALGVLAGFLLRLGFIPTLFLGRLTNLLFFAFLASWAVKRTPVAKAVFATVALLPMTLHLAASYSRDSNLLALCLLFAALVLDLAFGPTEKISWKQLILPALAGLLIVPSKIVYFPLALLVFLIPAARLGRFSKAIKGGFLVLCMVVFLSSAGGTLTLGGFVNGDTPVAAGAASSSAAVQEAEPAASVAAESESAPALESTASSGETAVADSAPQPASEEPVQDDSVCYSLPYILSHPLDTVELLIRSVVEYGEHYVKTLVGGTLSYFDPGVQIAWTWVAALLILLVLAWLQPGFELPVWAKTVCLLIGLACCGLAVLGCVSWTPTYYTTIYGLQGRYFLPVLSLLLLARPRRLLLQTDFTRGLVYAVTLVDILVVFNAFLSILAR